MKHSRLLLLGISILALSACQTWDGLMNDMGDLDLPTLPSSENAVDMRADELTTNADCPQIEIVDELNTVNQFTAGGAQAANLIAGARFGQAQMACEYTPSAKSVTVDLKLNVEGYTGPQSGSASPPVFNHPYFVAVTDTNGDIMAKEIFTATHDFSAGAQQVYQDDLRQIIPVPDRERGRKFKVLVGFQLSKDQLAYNRAVIQAQREAAKAAAEAQKKAAANKPKAAPVTLEDMQITPAAPATPGKVYQNPQGGIVIPDNGAPVPLSPTTP